MNKSHLNEKSYLHEKTTALIDPNHHETYNYESSLDYSANETLPMEINDSTNLELNPVVKVGNGIDSLTFITTTPVGQSSQASISLENTWNEPVDLHLVFQESLDAARFDPLFPFFLRNSSMKAQSTSQSGQASMKISLRSYESRNVIIEFKPSEAGQFSSILEVHELTTDSLHKLRLKAKSGKAHIEMDMSAVQLDMKPPGFMEPSHNNIGTDLNGTMVLDPVTYLGELGRVSKSVTAKLLVVILQYNSQG